MEQGSAEPGPGPYTMDGLCNLYLPVILLMRAGDIETNPGPNTPESTVSEEEYLELSERIDPSDYKRVGIRLGIPYTVLSGIKKQSDDYSDHFMSVFMKWRDKQPQGTNTRVVLAEELQTCNLGELSDLLLDGSLVQCRTSKPSALPSTSKGHQPLSPELVQRCSEDFKSIYRTTLCKIRADPLNPDSLMQFEDMYTNLVLEKEHGRKKRKLKYCKLFKLKDNGKFPRRLLVQGEAGAGKTTLCAKIAWDWINGKHLQDVAWLIIVPLREAQKYTIGEIAKSYLTSNNPATASQLTEYMHLNQDKVFILFDGLDEFSGNVAQHKRDGSQSTGYKYHSHQSSQAEGHSSQSSSGSAQLQAEYQSTSGQKERKDVSSVGKGIGIVEILQSEKLDTCPVIVTTRPWKAKEIRWNQRLRKLYSFLYVEGFSKQNVAKYIKKYFVGEKAKAESLIQFANDNDVISENMAPYPIYIAMLCLMWREYDEKKREIMKSLQTFSQIFKEIFIFLKEHYAMKIANPLCSVDESLNDRLQKINTLLEPIASLAFDGLLNKTLVFKESDFEKCPDSMKTACRVGVLSEENRIIPRKERHDANNLRKQSTVFFPHKLFQEFMAGIHLASLYETDKGKYSRLIKKLTGQRKEEFRYLLYFTVSQNQTVGINVLTHIKRSMGREGDSHFLVDVAFECHDTDTASLVKDKVSLPNSTLNISHGMTAHTVAGYAFIQPDMVSSLKITGDVVPVFAPALYELTVALCLMPNLTKLTLTSGRILSEEFCSTLKSRASFMKLKSLQISESIGPVSAPALHDLAVTLCSLPNLTELTVPDHVLSDEFCSTLKARASSLKLKSLEISGPVVLISAPSSHDLVVALCLMPNLTKLTMPGTVLSHEFCSTLKGRSSIMKVKSFNIRGASVPVSAPASHDLVVALCSMQNLSELTMPGEILSDEFCSTLKAKASVMKVKSFNIREASVPVSAPASPDLVVALCSMPNLSELTMPGEILSDEFCSTLKARASVMKVKSFNIREASVPVSAPASRDLVVALCSMPNLSELTMPGEILSDEFCSTLKARASVMKVKSFNIIVASVLACAPASYDLVVAFCSMPNLSELTVPGEIVSDKFCSTFKAWASFMKVKSLHISGRMVPVLAPSSHDLVAALCSMPNLTELTVPSRILSDEFCSTLKARASSMKVKSLQISGRMVPVFARSSHDLVAALCSMPNLTELKVPCRILSDEFCSTLKARATSMKLKSLKISGPVDLVSAPASHDLAVALCSIPNLTKLTMPGNVLSDEFCSTLKARTSIMKVKSFNIRGASVSVSAPASHDLVEALCSMPNLNELTMPGEILSDEFCSTLKARASIMKVKSFNIIVASVPVSAPASRDLVVALCSMPNLSELKMPGEILSDEFCSTFKVKASSMKVKSFNIRVASVPVSAPASHDLVVALCSMPNLNELIMPCEILSDEFCSSLKARTSSMKVKFLTITTVSVCHVPAPPLHDLLVALCSMPNLTKLTVPGEILSDDEFCSALKARASSMKVKSFYIRVASVPVSALASHDLVVALCLMPNLNELTVPDVILSAEFCSTLKAMASSMKLKSLQISSHVVLVSAPASDDLAVALCSMPNLTELTMPVSILSDEFGSTLRTRASSMKNCFPQISKGNFTFNGSPQANLKSFIRMLPVPPSYYFTEDDQNEWKEEVKEEEEEKKKESTADMYTDVSDASWYPPEIRPRGLDTICLCRRGSGAIAPSVKQVFQPSVSYDQPGTSRDTDGVHQTYEEQHSVSRHSGYSTSHRRELDTSVSVMRGSHSIPSVSPPVQSSVPCDHPGTSRDTVGIYQTCHEEHVSISGHSGYSTSHPVSSFDSHSEPTSPLPHQADRPMSNVLQLPLTVRSRNGRFQSVKRTAPCTQSRVPKDIPEKRPRVGTAEESPSVKLCDYSSSDESSTS